MPKFILLLALLAPMTLAAHGGGLDANRCNTDHKPAFSAANDGNLTALLGMRQTAQSHLVYSSCPSKTMLMSNWKSNWIRVCQSTTRLHMWQADNYKCPPYCGQEKQRNCVRNNSYQCTT